LPKYRIEDIYLIAKKRDGLCLSTTYSNNNTKLQWQCKKGHIWYATLGHINQGSWCPICAIQK